MFCSLKSLIVGSSLSALFLLPISFNMVSARGNLSGTTPSGQNMNWNNDQENAYGHGSWDGNTGHGYYGHEGWHDDGRWSGGYAGGSGQNYHPYNGYAGYNEGYYSPGYYHQYPSYSNSYPSYYSGNNYYPGYSNANPSYYSGSNYYPGYYDNSGVGVGANVGGIGAGAGIGDGGAGVYFNAR